MGDLIIRGSIVEEIENFKFSTKTCFEMTDSKDLS